jgi:hypothetical protein
VLVELRMDHSTCEKHRLTRLRCWHFDVTYCRNMENVFLTRLCTYSNIKTQLPRTVQHYNRHVKLYVRCPLLLTDFNEKWSKFH